MNLLRPTLDIISHIGDIVKLVAMRLCTNDLWVSFSLLAEKGLVSARTTSIIALHLGYELLCSQQRTFELRKAKSCWMMYI